MTHNRRFEARLSLYLLPRGPFQPRQFNSVEELPNFCLLALLNKLGSGLIRANSHAAIHPYS